MSSPLHETQCSRLSEFIAGRMGLHFPRERWNDLERGFAGAAHEFGFADPAACVGWLLSTAPTRTQLQVLANHLTIGETYFFRDKPTLQALSEHVLPELIRSRRGREQRLRLWSAACCSGEEAYTLAILLHQLLPDLRNWHVTILATDINARFLHKAAAGTYGEWSFRDAPAGLKKRYFQRNAEGRYSIVPEIRKLVRFAHLNLVEDAFPALATDTNAMDLILCRNVLMYFTPAQIERVIGNLHHALVDGAWLAVSPSEATRTLFSQFSAVNFPGAVLFRKTDALPQIESIPASYTPMAEPCVPEHDALASWTPEATADCAPLAQAPVETREPLAVAQSFYQEGHYAQAVDTLLAAFARSPPEPAAFSLLTRALANLGRLVEALSWCERWIAAEKLDAAAHYLRAVVLLEQGDAEQARASLQRTLYLQPDFVLAHFALGNLARSCAAPGAANKHFDNALRTLARLQPNDVLPESEGLTAARLMQTIMALTDQEGAA